MFRHLVHINSIALFMLPTEGPANSLTTNQATLWNICLNPVAELLFCCDHIGQIKILHLYIWDE
jgi:hypothetical protein